MLMKRLLLAMLLLLTATSLVQAQDEDATEPAEAEPPSATVAFDSIFARLMPSPDAEAVASLYEDNRVEVVGRNLDGTWFEVRRPARMSNLGWVLARLLDFDFAPENLPLTDLETGIEGPTPLMEDPGIAVFVNENVIMRTQPFGQGQRLPTVPAGSVVPLIARDHVGEWLLVNYRGHQGWIIGFTVRQRPEIMTVPLAPGLPPLQSGNVAIIPPEIQLAQVQRMRDFLQPRGELASRLAGFWEQVISGEIMPCDVPEYIAVALDYGPDDVRELPEIHRILPRANEGVLMLETAVAPLRNCGVIDNETLGDAYRAAINASTIINGSLGALRNLETEIIR